MYRKANIRMKANRIIYCIRQGVQSIRRNGLFSLASVVTIAACVFLFGIFFSIVLNLQYMVKQAESTVGISVFFDDNLTEDEIMGLGETIQRHDSVAQIVYVSPEEAWERYKERYFADYPELAEGFENDNPLADSASYEVFVTEVEQQDAVAQWLQSLPGIRRVKYSELAAGGLEKANQLISLVSAGLILILLVVAVFLISNTISLAYAVRREEIEIMKWLGATNAFVRAPFVVEGLMIGLVGAAIPLLAVFFLYQTVVRVVMDRFGILLSVLKFLPPEQVMALLIPVGLLLGAGIGFMGSFFTIRKQLKV